MQCTTGMAAQYSFDLYDPVLDIDPIDDKNNDPSEVCSVRMLDDLHSPIE